MSKRERGTASLALFLMLLATAVTWYSIHSPFVIVNSKSTNRFSFEHYSLNYAGTGHNVRRVNPSLEHLASWISAVGAAVAINDLDGDGFANDLCLVDPRTDTVTVAPVPGSGQRYKPFILRPGGVPGQNFAPMGCLPGDFNQDGTMDLLVYYWGRGPVIFFSRGNSGKAAPLGPDSYIAHDLAPASELWYTNAALVADFDGDGYPDILLANYFADGEQILDASSAQEQRLNSSMSHAFNGGTKHIFLAVPGGVNGEVNQVTFREAAPLILGADDKPMSSSDTAAVMHGWTLAAGTADLSNHLLPDLYLANDFGPDRLFQNESTPGNVRLRLVIGHRDLFTPKSKVLGRDSFKGMGVDFADLNRDGRLDILVSSITEEFGLEESNLDYVNTCTLSGAVDLSRCLHDQSEKLGLARSGWAWDVKAADFDNSGTLQILQATGFVRSSHSAQGANRWPELHETAMGNDAFLRFPGTWHNYSVDDDLSGHDRNRFFVRQGDGPYQDVSEQIGLRHDWVGRGIAIADVDGDGRLDFAIANQWGPSDFYRNVSSAIGSQLTLRLLLPLASQRFAVAPIGAVHDATWAMTAEATVMLPDGHLLREDVNGGNGHSGKNSFDLHFGLGKVPPGSQINVKLRWRDRSGHIASRELQLNPGQYSILLGA